MGLENVVRTLGEYWEIGRERAKLAEEQKGPGSEGFISKNINRRVSAPLAKILYDAHQNINPDYITLFSTGIGLAGAASFCLSKGNPLYAIIGGALAQASSIFDGVDGDYVRYLTDEQISQTQKSFGQYLDSALDRVVDLAVIYGMGVYLNHVFPNNSWVMPLTYFTMASSFLSTYKNNFISKVYNKYEHIKSYVRNKIHFLGRRDLRLFALFLGGIGEGLSYVTPIPKGASTTLSLTFVLGANASSFINSFFELRSNLEEAEKISQAMPYEAE